MKGALPTPYWLARVRGRELVEIRRGLGHAHRQRAKIVQRGDLDFAGIDRVENARHQTQANAVAEFRELEAEVANLPQHRPAVRVAAGIPAG